MIGQRMRRVDRVESRTVAARAAVSRLPGRARTRLAIVAISVAAAVVVAGQRRVACGPAAGTWLDSAGGDTAAAATGGGQAERGAAGRLRVGTFNIHGGKGIDGVRDLERTARSLAGLDVAGLNEVHGAWFWQRADQAELLGRRLEMDWLFAPTEQRWFHYRFGNGLLSGLPVAWWQRIPLPREYGKSYRNLLLAQVEKQGVTIQVVVAHIDRSDDRERAAQLRQAGDLFLALAEPAVLMGDMNSDATDAGIRRLLSVEGVRDPVGEKLRGQTPRRIDWILVRGLEWTDAGIVHEGASDHPHVWVELALPAAR